MATAIYISFGVETLGRKRSLFISAMGMGTLFYIVGAILKTHPVGNSANPTPASKAMAAMLYIYVCFYSMGWGEFMFELALQCSLTVDRTSAVGLRVRYLSHSHAALWPCVG